MGASGARPAVDVTASDRRPGSSPAAVVEFAAEELLHGAAPEALSAVLSRLAGAFGGQAALAAQYTAGRKLVVLAAHPQRAAADPALLASVGALCAEHADGADRGYVQAPLAPSARPGAPRASVLLVCPPPDEGQPPCAGSLCTLALVGDASGWAGETRSTMRAIAAIVAAQIRQANTAAELAERQAVSSALIKGSPDAILAGNSDTRIVEFNPAAEELFGRRRDDVLGRRMAEIMAPEEQDRFLQHAETYLRSGDMGEFVGRVRVPVLRPDGTRRQAELTPWPLTVEGEVHFCGFLRDFTELEQAQAALADSEALFRLLAQVAPVGIVQTDADGKCVFANDRWCVLTGMTAEDALAGDWTQALHPDDIPRIEQEWARAAAHGTELRTDCRLRTAAGAEVWVHAGVVPLPGPDDQPAGYLAALTNISDRKRAEAERERLLAAEQSARSSLAGQTERLNSLLASAIPGVFIADEHGLITQLNKSFCDLFGIEDDPGQLIGTPAAQFVRRIREVFADPADFARRAKRALTERKPVRGDEIACADGRTFACDYWPVAVSGEHRGDLLLMWDVSERKAFEEQRERLLTAEFAAREMAELARQQLEEQNARLLEADEAKTKFLDTVSHELRTPLTSIVSFTELIRETEDELSPDTISSLEVIERNSQRLLRLVGDLLLLRRIEDGIIPLDRTPLSIPELVREVASSASASAARRDIRIEVTAEDGPTVLADRNRLQQVFDNLLSNAVKFSDPGGRVRIAATPDGRAWRVDVADSGIGIPPDELSQVFDRFVRASNARKASVPGTGLGLSVVKGITELHGGRVEAESTVGAGTTFRVYLPISR